MTENTPIQATETECIAPTDVIFDLYCFQDGKCEMSQDEKHEQTLRLAAKHNLATLVLDDPIILGRGPTHSISALTALGRRCVDAYKSGKWGRILHGFRKSGKDPTLEEMIAAICEAPTEATAPTSSALDGRQTQSPAATARKSR